MNRFRNGGSFGRNRRDSGRGDSGRGEFGRRSSGRRESDREEFGNRRDSGRGDFGRREGRGRIEMHEVVCDKCGKNCEVPFLPSSDKPVYCSDCFRQEGGNGRFNSRRESGNNSSGLKEINEKLDKIILLLESE